ncbi:porimin [Dromiciops gliroides]|uniref:porimin n=1 Tax=Dromiciops gliroides TaxID=33562 RepID=UPI001CC39296|nr:porimin [Dromiciops gliroides]
MRLSAVATSAPLLVVALQVLFLLEAAHSQNTGKDAKTNHTTSEILQDKTNGTEVQSNVTSTIKPVTTTPASQSSSANTTASINKTTEKPQVTTKLSTPGTNTTVKPLTTTRSTTAHSASKSSAATASNNSTVTTMATLATANINAKMNKGSKFDIGSFVGGIVLTLGVLSVLYIGCKTYYSRGIRYRTIDEHDAII